MDFISDNSSLLLVGLLLTIIFVFCGWVVKRYWIDKKWMSEGSRFVSRNVYAQFQNEDRKDAIEHVIYMTEQERQDDKQGEDKKPDVHFESPD